jgi:hypothetical protein
MKRIFLFLLLLLFCMAGFGQEYRHALGIRGGLTPGVEYRQYFNDNFSGKFLLGWRNSGLQFHGLFEIHRKDLFIGTDQFDFLYGAGLYGGYQRWHEIRHEGKYDYAIVKSGMVAGIDGLIGMEYTSASLPVSIGLEAKPILEFGGEPGFDIIPWDLAFTIKYLF